MIDIQKRVLSKKFVKMYYKIFDDFVLNTCLENGAWIAGGFARKTALIYNRIDNNYNSYEIKPLESMINYFHKESGDVDIFVKSDEMLNNICNKIGLHSPDGKTFSNVIQDDHIQNDDSNFRRIFISPFALNVHSYGNTLQCQNLRTFPMQIVNKFMFNSIKDCFKSFDIKNCMYAISKENNQYILHYDKKALELDKLKKVSINHNNSPYLGNRLYKYLSHKGLTIEETESNQNILKEYYFKILSNTWPEIYNLRDVKQFSKCSMQNISKVIKMSANDLSIFIGKYTEITFKKKPNLSGYGFYLTAYENDWALNKINNMWG